MQPPPGLLPNAGLVPPPTYPPPPGSNPIPGLAGHLPGALPGGLPGAGVAGAIPNPALMMGLMGAPNASGLVYQPGLLPGPFPTLDPAVLAAMSAMLMQQTHGNQAAAEAEASPPQSSAPTTTWKELRSEEGRIFWHNTKTGKSTWDKPDELRSDMERILATSTSWREYQGAEEGIKTYWHHLDTKRSEWGVPEEVATIMASIKELEAEDWTVKTFDGKSAARTAYKTFLERRGVGFKAKWEDVGKILQADPKWKAFDPYLTVGERKHLFNELVNQLQKRTREQQRVKKAAARDAMGEFLTKWRNGEEDFYPMAADATYEEFEERAQREPWFYLLDAADKAEAFEEAAQMAADEISPRLPKKKYEEIERFLMDLDDDELPLDSSASQVVQVVQESLCHIRSHPLAILAIWQNFVQDRLNQKRQQAKRALYRWERQVRETFRQLLLDAESDGLVDAKSEWKDFLRGPAPKRRKVLADLDKAEGSTPAAELAVPVVTEPLAEFPTDKSEAEAPPSEGGDIVEKKESGIRVQEMSPERIQRERALLLEKLKAKVKDWMSQDPADDKETAAQAPEVSKVECKGEDANSTEREDGQLASNSTLEANDDSPRQICEHEAYLSLFIQGGSTARELFEDFVYGLWDVYEAIRPVVKSGLSTNSLLGQALMREEPVTKEEFAALLVADPAIALTEDTPLWKLANRPGVLGPLIPSVARRLRRGEENATAQ